MFGASGEEAAGLQRPMTEELAAQRRAEILARMALLDAESIRPLRAIVEGAGTDNDRQKLTHIESELAALRAEMAGLLPKLKPTPAPEEPCD